LGLNLHLGLLLQSFGRMGVVRREVNERAFLCELQNSLHRRAGNIFAGTNAVHLPFNQEFLVVARIAGQKK